MASRERGWSLAVCAAALVLAASLGAAAAGSLAPGDWRYDDLDALGRAGLLAGHPAGPLGDWAASLTRFEAASLTLRAVEGVGEAYEAAGEALRRVARAEPIVEPPVVESEHLARIEKLIQEFRTELVTMGAQLEDLAAALEGVKARVAAVEREQQRHRLDGYLQVRYREEAAADAAEFLIRRARINLRGPVSDRTAYRLELQLDAREKGQGPTSKTQVRTASVDYQLGRGRLRMGQTKVPWGYELLESSAGLWSGERSFLMDRLFPNQRDIGIHWAYRPAPGAPHFDLGVFNGTGINASDNNRRKNLMGRLDLPARWGSVALSAYVGKDGEGPAATRQDRFGLSGKLDLGPAAFLGEYVLGKDRGGDIQGWYAQLGAPTRAGRPDLLFAKYDVYDEDTDLAGHLFRRWSLGYLRDLDPATRLTLVHERRRPGPGFSELAKWDGDATFVQLQVRY